MEHYYVNNRKQSNGDHEVHREKCDKIPSDKKYLGYFSDCKSAVEEAKKTYSQSNGCYYCSEDCHTQ